MKNSFQCWASIQAADAGLDARPKGNWVEIFTRSGETLGTVMTEKGVLAICTSSHGIDGLIASKQAELDALLEAHDKFSIGLSKKAAEFRHAKLVQPAINTLDELQRIRAARAA